MNGLKSNFERFPDVFTQPKPIPDISQAPPTAHLPPSDQGVEIRPLPTGPDVQAIIVEYLGTRKGLAQR